jgi:hypothetical protein
VRFPICVARDYDRTAMNRKRKLSQQRTAEPTRPNLDRSVRRGSYKEIGWKTARFPLTGQA